MAAKSSQFNMERFFQALGDNTRLRLLNLMGDQEICVCYFVEILAQGQPKISRHLAYLRSAGIVEARREGKWMHYRIVMPPNIGAAQVLRQTLTLAWGGSCDAGGPCAFVEGLLQSSEVCDAARVLRGRLRWIVQLQSRLVEDGERTLYAGTDMRSTGAEEAFVSRSVSNTVDFSGDGGWSRDGAFCARFGCVCESLSERNYEYSDCHRTDHHDVPAAGEGALRETGRSVSPETCAGAIAVAELGDRPGADVRSRRRVSSRRTGLHARVDPDRHCSLHCDGAGVE